LLDTFRNQEPGSSIMIQAVGIVVIGGAFAAALDILPLGLLYRRFTDTRVGIHTRRSLNEEDERLAEALMKAHP
jgi:hypothetical protein